MALEMLCNVSVAFIHREGTFKSEATSQTYLGETLTVLEEQDDWMHITQQDGYTGWVAKFYLVPKPANWDTYDFYHHGERISWIYQSPDNQSSSIRDITLLSSLPVLAFQDAWVKVLLPDGNHGWIESSPRPPVDRVDVEALVQTALSFRGTQYFWGGKSPKGFDCSGFVQTTFWLNGVQLPRDAYQQAEIGEEVDGDFSKWQVGDLIFFSERGDRITHVALSLGDGDFIHASGYVKLNSMNPDHEDLYLEKYTRMYATTRRVI